MSPVGIKRLLNERPFKPFTIHTGDGSTVDVLSPDFAVLHPGGQTLWGWVPLKSGAKDEEDFENHQIDAFLITKATSPPARAHRNGGKRPR